MTYHWYKAPVGEVTIYVKPLPSSEIHINLGVGTFLELLKLSIFTSYTDSICLVCFCKNPVENNPGTQWDLAAREARLS